MEKKNCNGKKKPSPADCLRRDGLWLCLLVAVDLFGGLLLWLADVQAFEKMLGVLVLFSAVLLSAAVFLADRKEKKRTAAFGEFLKNPEEEQKEALLPLLDCRERELLLEMEELLRRQREELRESRNELTDYEEYVETWAHETKTPLSLMTMVLDNHMEELPKQVGFKLEYARARLQEQVGQMLYYARLKGVKKDYRMETLELGDCICEVLQDYRALLEEKKFTVKVLQGGEADGVPACADTSTADGYNRIEVFADRRGLLFLLGQAVSNSIKYCAEEPLLFFEMERREKTDVLWVCDNGTGVRACDLPYIFEKGFTGDSEKSRKKATGMGLYLAAKIAADLGLGLEASSVQGEGFALGIEFPRTDDRAGGR